MRRPLALVGSLLTLACCAAAAPAAQPTEPPLALHGLSGKATTLSRLDPLTLAPTEPSTIVPEWHGGYSVAPGGGQAAFTVATNGLPPTPGQGRVGIRVIDLATMEFVAEFRTGIAGSAAAWLAPRRIVAHVQGGRVWLLDPVSGDARRTGSIAGGCIDPTGKGSTGRLLVMRLGSRLATVDKHGRVRTVRLTGMEPGCFRRGFALDPVRNRAYAFDAGRRAATVNLSTMRASFTALPELDANAVAYTRGVLLGTDRVATGHQSTRGMPKGVELIDFAKRSRRMIDRAAGRAILGDGLLLAYDGRQPVTPGGSRGLRAYSRSGAPRFRVLGGEVVHRVEVLGRFAYAQTRAGLRVVDLRTREVVSRSELDPELEIDFVLPGRAGAR